ncbi:MAG: hypothetical protein JXA00_06235 [Candidatus Thermoplasmatota archaeon]|nr:hypothetical protein [Candidatus Thermoplasmatota archaeon]
MKIKSRKEILTDIIRDAQHHPRGWNAAFGKDPEVSSSDCFIFHPDIGIYLLKEYTKNPFETKGIGSKLARHIDDDIHEQLTKHAGDFGIIQGNIQKILFNLNKGIPPQTILRSAMHGEDLGITIPVQGSASTSQETFSALCRSFSPQHKKLASRFEHLASDDGLYTAYG